MNILQVVYHFNPSSTIHFKSSVMLLKIKSQLSCNVSLLIQAKYTSLQAESQGGATRLAPPSTQKV